jgi:hypothetical protein
MRKVGTTARFTKGMMVTVKPKLDYKGRPEMRWEKVDGEWTKTGTPLCEDVWRKTTRDEVDAWYASDDSKGMNDAGESKLPPQSVYRTPKPDEVFKVVRARVKARRGWHDVPGCALVEDSEGVQWFVLRVHLH